MSELQILDVRQTLIHGNVAIRFEGHHSQWTTWKHVADDKFGKHVKTNLNVCNSLHHSQWNNPDEGNDESDDERPPCQMRWPMKNSRKAESNHDNEDGKEPPVRSLKEIINL